MTQIFYQTKNRNKSYGPKLNIGKWIPFTNQFRQRGSQNQEIEISDGIILHLSFFTWIFFLKNQKIGFICLISEIIKSPSKFQRSFVWVTTFFEIFSTVFFRPSKFAKRFWDFLRKLKQLFKKSKEWSI